MRTVGWKIRDTTKVGRQEMSRNLSPQSAIRNPEQGIPERVLVVGMGATGVSCARFLAGLGRQVTITDMKPECELPQSLYALKDVPFKGRFGTHHRQDFLDHQLIVISPGIITDHPLLEEARRNGATVIGEIELASRFIEEPIIAITGTNGKTTTTTLLGRVFEAAFGHIFVGGNIGDPLINYVLNGKKAQYVIAEISSFQLETIESFRPHIAVLLNITEDHLDRYITFADYVAAKMAIFKNQMPHDLALLSTEIEGVDGIAARKLFFSTTNVLDEGAYLEGNVLTVRIDGRSYHYRRDLSPLVGIHNSENLLSVLLASHLCGIEQPVIETAIRNFRGLPHRVEFVREIGGVRFYNDSKATNVDATKRALESIEGKVILIAGGKDKGGGYSSIVGLKDRIKGLVLIGEARERIEAELGQFMMTYAEDGLQQAAERALAMSATGDTVLFSPMCSSFDMFESYKARGNAFKQIVERL
jgi:UDP-N-acetylmuramoylalanine--D-glutamate ligase